MDDTLTTLIVILGIVPTVCLLAIKIYFDRPTPKPKKEEQPKVKETIVKPTEAPKNLPLEIIRELSGSSEPIVIKRKGIKRTDEIVEFQRMKPLPRAYFIKHIIKRETQVPNFYLGVIRRGTKTKTDYLARANEYWSETLSSLNESIPTFSRELENLLFGDDESQMIAGVANIQKFSLDSTMLKLMILVFAMSIPFGFLLIVGGHLIPSQIVIWSP